MAGKVHVQHFTSGPGRELLGSSVRRGGCDGEAMHTVP